MCVLVGLHICGFCTTFVARNDVSSADTQYKLPMYKILITDDEDDICMILSYSLQQAGYEVCTANSAAEALPMIRAQQFSLLLLDIMMDGMSGWELVEQLRREGLLTMPVIYLTALGDEVSVLRGFQTGADDYIAKPFHIPEVLARIAAVLRRTTAAKPTDTPDCLAYEGVVLDKRAKSLKVDGVSVSVTRTEWELLHYLLQHQGVMLTRNDLLAAVWTDGGGCVLERTVDVHITHLRRKLKQYGDHIVTKSGYGYMWTK